MAVGFVRKDLLPSFFTGDFLVLVPLPTACLSCTVQAAKCPLGTALQCPCQQGAAGTAARTDRSWALLAMYSTCVYGCSCRTAPINGIS